MKQSNPWDKKDYFDDLIAKARKNSIWALNRYSETNELSYLDMYESMERYVAELREAREHIR